MYFEHRSKTGNPVIDKLIVQSTDTQREIQCLHHEIQTLRATIQSKQRRVNKINLRIAQLRERQTYIRPVEQPDSNNILITREYNDEVKHYSSSHLVCLQGGKP